MKNVKKTDQVTVKMQSIKRTTHDTSTLEKKVLKGYKIEEAQPENIVC